MTRIADVKVLLGIKDTQQDDVLGVIERLTEDHFLAYTGQGVVPVSCEFLIKEVMVKRFNRIGSEGMSSQSIEGLSQTFTLDDFEEYKSLLTRLFDLDSSGTSGVKFL